MTAPTSATTTRKVSAQILGETVHLLRNVGLAADHAILIGGLAPGLLVLDPGPGRSAHAGTTDLDFCLSVALVEGETARVPAHRGWPKGCRL